MQASYLFNGKLRRRSQAMTLTTKQRKEMKAKAHHLKPVIRVGQKGLSENLLEETSLALDIHELIKVHVALDDRQDRARCMQELASKSEAEMVAQIGKMCILYRQRADS
jgi:RNA-binding protein